MFCYAFGLGWVLPNAMAGAIGPFPRMAGLAAAGAGFVQLTGSALYAIAVSHTYDGTLRPMTTAVATAGIAPPGAFALLRRGAARAGRTGRGGPRGRVPPPPPPRRRPAVAPATGARARNAGR